MSEEGVHAAGSNRNQHHPSHLRLFFQLFGGVSQGASSHPCPTGYSAQNSRWGGLCIFCRTLSLNSSLLSQLCPTPAGCFWVPGIGSTLNLPCCLDAHSSYHQGQPQAPPDIQGLGHYCFVSFISKEDKPRPCHSAVVGAKGSLQPETTAL